MDNQNRKYIDGELTPIYLLRLDDVEKIIRGIIAEQVNKSHNEQNNRLVSPKEASEILGVDRSSLWRWEKSKYLLPVRIGGKVRYRLKDIENLINNG